MTADPKNPKVGDRFITSGGAEVEVTAVGRRHALAARARDGFEFTVSLSVVAINWRPVPEPLVIYERQQSDGWTWWSSSSQATHFAQATGRKRILHPDGTWTEEGP